MEPLVIYNKTYKSIQSIYSSRLKIQILLSISSGPKSLADLREVTGSTSQAIIPKIRGLERLSLIESGEKGYVLTSVGKIITAKIENFIMTMAEVMHHQEFLSTHDIMGIPEPFLLEIGDLLDSELKYDTPDDMFHVFSHFVKILKDAKYIYGISSVMSPEIAEVLRERIVAGIPIELVVNKKVAETLRQEPFASVLKELLNFDYFRIWVTEEALRVGITVTDKHLSFGLNKKEGNLYDGSVDLYSSNPRAINWAKRLFDYYKSRSKILTME
ncbi:MAG TPA: transcriptional regulator FilR1 domain-containing protein [Methanomicrobiales archaeon]|jgi:predicted transcriptional regulator|nr:transcriptional regulator FilR1 domain-containing protein [Methanomicrobiales archaeon]